MPTTFFRAIVDQRVAAQRITRVGEIEAGMLDGEVGPLAGLEVQTVDAIGVAVGIGRKIERLGVGVETEREGMPAEEILGRQPEGRRGEGGELGVHFLPALAVVVVEAAICAEKMEREPGLAGAVGEQAAHGVDLVHLFRPAGAHVDPVERRGHLGAGQCHGVV